ncbi:hypothetical protein C8T65DRAFT_694602 [Cerioporus squamosus]|nr:hypothetical protein C8T65DRAFT_694600 [Cerioporus squamosus]KAI0715777.1 hypothetical protein C8T65DRAFT_694602 [Cerioporus squamosus]
MAPVYPHLLQHACAARPAAVRSSMHAALLYPLPTPPPIPVFVRLVPGVPLTMQLPEPDYSDPRGSVRLLLTELLVRATRDPCARMWWAITLFHKEVALRYGMLLYGWPPDIPFANLSTGHGSPTMAQVRRLLALLTARPQPLMYFVRATPEQMRAVQLDIAAAAPGPLYPAPVPLPYISRCDIGRRRGVCRDADGGVIPPRYIRNGPKSAKVISEELDSEASGWEPVRTGPLPQMFKDGAWLIWGGSGWRLPTTSELLNADWDGRVY